MWTEIIVEPYHFYSPLLLSAPHFLTFIYHNFVFILRLTELKNFFFATIGLQLPMNSGGNLFEYRI